MLNTAQIAGRLVTDPILRKTAEGKSVANITVAVDRDFKKEGSQSADEDFKAAQRANPCKKGQKNYTYISSR